MRKTVQVLILVSIASFINSDTIKENKTIFIATNEWQEIKKGQAIPQGLHVRINLQTGLKEAKLLDENEEDKSKNNKILSTSSTTSTQATDNSQISKTLEQALKEINKDSQQITWLSEDSETKIKKTYKDYKQLKKDYEEMKTHFKTDLELITGLLKELNNTNSENSNSLNQRTVETILTDLNFLGHQIDNSLWFIDSGGLNYVVLPMIVNQTNLSYRILSLRLLGALTQNNPKAQIRVFESNFGYYISNILLQSTNKEEISAAIYAFGSMLRKFPHAQKEVLSKSGTKALISVLAKNTDLKIKSKVLTLITDLLSEKDLILQTPLSDLHTQELDKIEQYKQVDFEKWLKENEFCDIVSDFFYKNENEILKLPDVADDIIEGISNSHIACQYKWHKSSILKNTLKTIERTFRETEKEYLVEVAHKAASLNRILNNVYQINDEL